VPKGKAAVIAADSSIGRLLQLFSAWKLVLFVVACANPGPGYDTSTRILFDQHRTRPAAWLDKLLEPVLLRLTRWDAVYFASGSMRGQVFEQEWAFRSLFAQITSVVTRGA